MAEKELTHKEVSKRGALVTNARYADKKKDWGKKGGQSLKEKYGADYFKKIRQGIKVSRD